MFEHDNTANIWRGAAYRNARQASDAVDTANHNYEAAQRYKRDLAEALARIVELEDQLAVKTAGGAGLKAQLDAYKNQHPDSPVARDSGKRYRDGAIKTVGRIAYETAFDMKLREIAPGIEPRTRRED